MISTLDVAVVVVAVDAVVRAKMLQEIRQHRWRQLQGGWGAYEAAAAAAGWYLSVKKKRGRYSAMGAKTT